MPSFQNCNMEIQPLPPEMRRRAASREGGLSLPSPPAPGPAAGDARAARPPAARFADAGGKESTFPVYRLPQGLRHTDGKYLELTFSSSIFYLTRCRL